MAWVNISESYLMHSISTCDGLSHWVFFLINGKVICMGYRMGSLVLFLQGQGNRIFPLGSEYVLVSCRYIFFLHLRHVFIVLYTREVLL